MSRGSAHSKHEVNNMSGEGDLFDLSLVIRLVIASVIFTVALIVKLPGIVSIALLVCAALIAGYDIILDATRAIQSKDILSTPVIVVVIAVVTYAIGFYSEGAALILLYQIGLMLVSYAAERTKRTALELLRYRDEDTVNSVNEILSNADAGTMRLESTMKNSAGSVLIIAMLLALAYAVFYPLISGSSYIVSIHRAITIIIIATPMSLVASFPSAGIVGLCYSAQQGVIFKNVDAMEKTANTGIFVFDKTGVFTEECPRVIDIHSDYISPETFMRFAGHASYYSEQTFAKAILAYEEQEFMLDIIEDFSEIPGLGVDLMIGGSQVTLASRELFYTRGIRIPVEIPKDGQAYYMTISGKYVGYVLLSDDVNEESADIVEQIVELGEKRCILLTESGKNESQAIADTLGFSEFYGECNTDKKLKFLKDLNVGKKSDIAYIYANSFDSHSSADIDMRVGKKGKYADVLIDPQDIANIPFSLQVCARVKEIAVINAFFSFAVKAVLIFLSMIGYCNVWFAIFIDMVAACATVLNTIRVTKESVLNVLKYKIG